MVLEGVADAEVLDQDVEGLDIIEVGKVGVDALGLDQRDLDGPISLELEGVVAEGDHGPTGLERLDRFVAGEEQSVLAESAREDLLVVRRPDDQLAVP